MFHLQYKIEGNEVAEFRNFLWMKVFHHDSSGKDYFLNENEAVNLVTEKKYNKFRVANDMFKIRGKYEFIINWPRINEYFRWRQSKNPIDEYEEENKFTADGFEPIRNASDKNGCKWGGLVRTTMKYKNYKNSLIKGCPGQAEWFFAVGMYNTTDGWYNSGIPDYKTCTDLVDVWARLPDFYKRKYACKNRRRFLFSIFLVVTLFVTYL